MIQVENKETISACDCLFHFENQERTNGSG
jgi:hypothetical protein